MSLISNVVFYLLNDMDGLMSNTVTIPGTSGTKDENGIYTFKTRFEAPSHSSFGFTDDSFKTFVGAEDTLGRQSAVTEDQLPENASPEDFVTRVRVKEQTDPYIQTTENWASNLANTTFVAEFITYDLNNNFRLAGINLDSLKIYLGSDEQSLVEQSLNEEFLEIVETEHPFPNSDIYKNNNKAYIIRYTFNDLENGSYIIKATIEDNDGNGKSAQGSIVINAVAPSLVINTPKEDAIYSDERKFELTGSVDVASNIYVKIYKDDVLVNQDIIEVSSEAEFNFAKIYTVENDGYYRIDVYAENKTAPELKSNTISRNIDIDITPPEIFSVKFYPVGSDVPIDFTKENLLGGNEYEIRIEAR